MFKDSVSPTIRNFTQTAPAARPSARRRRFQLPDPNANSYTNSNSNGHALTNSANANTDSYPNSNSNPYAHSDSNADTDFGSRTYRRNRSSLRQQNLSSRSSLPGQPS